MSAEPPRDSGEDNFEVILERISRLFFSLELTLTGEAASRHLQTDPVDILQRGAFLIGESRAPGFVARVGRETGASAGIHVNTRQKRFECAGAHTSTSGATARRARPRPRARRARSICASRHAIEGYAPSRSRITVSGFGESAAACSSNS